MTKEYQMNDKYLAYIEQSLIKVFNNIKAVYPEKLYLAMEYAVFSGGKRIRPYLTLLSAEFLGIAPAKVMSLAVAIELIHSYSLVHDDLPAMDNDDTRRDKPTCHKIFGEAMAILAGDALLNLAFEHLLDASIKDASILNASKFIASQAGGLGMVGGQALEFSNLELNDNLYFDICAKKTAALILSAVFSPALIKSSRLEYNALYQYGKSIGHIFQYVDDLLDLDTGSDLIKNKQEFIAKSIYEMKTKAINAMTPFNKKGDKLIEFCNYLTIRTK
ncbi:MAG: polyprenyl synthetase family protein [Clostridiales bacterium]|nr:polyprenyl synthetase family protein [Clostridiales bacterium]